MVHVGAGALVASQVALALIAFHIAGSLPGNRLQEDVLGPVSQDALEPLAEMDAAAETVTPNLGFGVRRASGPRRRDKLRHP